MSHTPSKKPDCLAAAEQARQPPVHASEQHTLSTQKPLVHSLGELHAAPIPNFPTHCPPTHCAPGAQFATVAQLVAQLEPPPQTNGAQLGLPAELAGRFVQTPFWLAPCDARHTAQLPAHGELQQTPSTQLPDWHSVPELQLWPLALSGTHVPPEQ
jgi:hypothetical protein